MSAFLQWLQVIYDPVAIWASVSAVLINYVGWSVAERILPAERGQSLPGAARNLAITLVYVLAAPTAAYISASVATLAAGQLGGPLLAVDFAAFLADRPAWFVYPVLVPLAFVPNLIFDFFFYWYHRFQHQWTWLWQVHRLHHTDSEVNVTTSLRHHWLEEWMRMLFILVPMTFLVKLTPAQVGFMSVVLTQWNWFVHCNVRLRMGILTFVFVGPQYHRIHHSIERRHWNRNYAAYFPVWDWLFKTLYVPAKDDWPKTGIEGVAGGQGFYDITVAPLMEWGRMIWRRFRAEPESTSLSPRPNR
jgi:sterol desaturase/sphingolipid hydroxylase (fatty acid hydroxylase superfamily)